MLQLNLIDIAMTIINVIILFFLLKKFLFKPVTTMIESRQKHIEDDLSAAESCRVNAQAMQEEYRAQLSGASEDIERLIAQARGRAEREAQAILSAAKEDAQALAAETQAQLKAERQEILTGVKREVAALALLAASKVSTRDLNSQDDEIFVESFLAEVGDRS